MYVGCRYYVFQSFISPSVYKIQHYTFIHYITYTIIFSYYFIISKWVQRTLKSCVLCLFNLSQGITFVGTEALDFSL